MKFLLNKALSLIFLSITFISCNKEYEDINQVDEKNIQAYLKQNNLNMQKYDTTSIYYQIVTPGAGDTVTNSDKIYLTYSYKTLNGEFSSEDESINRYIGFVGYLGPDFGLSYPAAFRTAVRDILKRKGGAIRIIIPSRLAFGRNGTKDIPGNASLDCTLRIYDVNSDVEFEDVFVQKYIEKNNITGLTKSQSGLYYQIINPGTGTEVIDDGTKITASYRGKLPNGTVFDENTSYSFYIGNVIAGWQEGIRLIKKGGKIRLIIPPTLAYGSLGSGDKIPPNAILNFEIEIKDLKQE